MSKKVSSGWLTVAAEDILAQLYSSSENCVGYNFFNDGKTHVNMAAIKELKQHGMIDFYRGLMTEEGEVAGSGWCRSTKGNEYVEEFEL